MSKRNRRLFTTVAVFTLCHALWSQSPVGFYREGQEARNAGNHYRAIESYRAALEKNPNYVEALIGMSESFFSLGEYADGLIYADRALLLDRTNHYLRSLKGRMLIGLERFSDAEAEFGTVLAAEPNQLDARFGMAELDVANGRVKNAIERFEDALKRLPDNRRALLSLVLLYGSLKEDEVSEEYIKAALRYHPSEPSVRYVAGKHYLERKQYDRAEYHIRLSINMFHEDRRSLELLAKIYLEQGKYEETIQLMEEMSVWQRDNPDLWYTLGLAYGHTGRIEDAIIAMTRVFRIQSDHEMARLAMEDLLIQYTSMEDPARHDAAAYHFKKAVALEERFLLDQALFEYRRGLLLNPYSIDGRLGYANIFRLKGYPAKYLRELDILLREGADDQKLHDELEIQRSIQSDNMADSWNVDQFLLRQKTTRILLACNPDDSRTIHYDAADILTRYLKAALGSVSIIDIVENAPVSGDFSILFQKARELGTDYFLHVTIHEGERSFAVHATVFLSRTGRKMHEFSVYRTGNDRIANTAARMSTYMNGFFPVIGTLVDRKFSTGLVDFGRMAGAREDDEYIIIRKDHLTLDKEKIGLVWEDRDVLGTFSITRPDELISEGTVKKKGFFDLINPGDLIISQASGTTLPLNDTFPSYSLFREILTVP